MNLRGVLIGSLAVAMGCLAPVVALAHDSVVAQPRPKQVKIRAAATEILTKVRITVVKGGSSKTATVPLKITTSAFHAANSKTPTRCTLRFVAQTVGDPADPTPSNNTAFLALNVLDANASDQATGPEVYLDTVSPAAITFHPGTVAAKVRKIHAKNGAIGDTGGQQLTVSAHDGTCPSGVAGAVDLDLKTPGTQSSLTIPFGSKKGATLQLSLNPAAFPPALALSPFRCSLDLTVTGSTGDTDATNNRISVALDVNGGAATLPALAQSDPIDSASAVARTRWIRLQFNQAVDPVAYGAFALVCDGQPQSFTTSALDPTVLIVNPQGSLPAGAACVLAWQNSSGPVNLSFSTAAAGAPASVLYDRSDATRTAPFPDDFWLQPDASTHTGVRVAMAVPDIPPGEQSLFVALLNEANQIDGFSPIGHFVIETSDAIDPTSIPTTREESVDPLATIGLFDIDPASATVGQRMPFRVDVRNDTNTLNVTSHTLMLFPSIPLTPRGHYGLLVTRGALVDATRPLDPSAFFSAALADPTLGEAAAVTRARGLARDVIDTVATYAALPIPADDVALALSISVRSNDDLPTEMVAMRQQVRALPPPGITITSVTAETQAGSKVAAFVKGTWEAPEFRNGVNLNRDGAGLPLLVTTNPIPFTLALPKAALNGPVPITMYQHGSPGDPAKEVPKIARQEMAAAGFALMGFRDVLNREVSPNAQTTTDAATQQVIAILNGLLANQKIPDYWIQTNAEQLGFVRALETLGTLDVLPVGAPDGVPDIDVGKPLSYFGISEGSVHAPALLAYEPDIHAAALVVGGARAVETIIHQQAETALAGVALFFPNLTAADIWVGFALFQADFDRQDTHNQAPFIYHHPLTISGTTSRASILMTEGLTDGLIPNNATDSLAWALGPLPHLQPVQSPVPFLTPVVGPVVANIDAATSAAFYQFVPAGVPGITVTPGCESQPEGHYCAQGAPVASAQRVAFFQSALTGAPTIINPLP
ncbi:MAG: hypothetical protein HY270_08910 [Deltaproteobacteria bacterium]|nr:hypothetical protein [Deltaproteobacteria bacterium]